MGKYQFILKRLRQAYLEKQHQNLEFQTDIDTLVPQNPAPSTTWQMNIYKNACKL